MTHQAIQDKRATYGVALIKIFSSMPFRLIVKRSVNYFTTRKRISRREELMKLFNRKFFNSFYDSCQVSLSQIVVQG